MKTLHNIISEQASTKHAKNYGTKIHNMLRHTVIDATKTSGDAEVLRKIQSTPGLSRFFCAQSKTEVPIAGTINGRFISRRIDRMHVDKNNRHIDVIDYKTDINPDANRTKYIAQINEYVNLLAAIYLDFSVDGYILWTHDFSLEQVVNKRT